MNDEKVKEGEKKEGKATQENIIHLLLKQIKYGQEKQCSRLHELERKSSRRRTRK